MRDAIHCIQHGDHKISTHQCTITREPDMDEIVDGKWQLEARRRENAIRYGWVESWLGFLKACAVHWSMITLMTLNDHGPRKLGQKASAKQVSKATSCSTHCT